MQLDELKRRTAERIARYWSRMTRGACVGGTILLLANALRGRAEFKRVLMLHSFGRDFKPWSEYGRTIRAELDRQSPWPLEITEHSLMSARSSDENPEAPFVEYLRALHSTRPIDLIVSLGAPAVAFVQRHRQQLFANTPMVFTAVEQRRVRYFNLAPNDTVVAVAHSFPAVFENMLRVLPKTKTVPVVSGNSLNERYWLEEMRREVRRFANLVRLASSNAPTTVPPEAKITSGASASNSAACLRMRAVSPAVQRVSMRMLRPSVQPNSCSPCTNAVMRRCA